MRFGNRIVFGGTLLCLALASTATWAQDSQDSNFDLQRRVRELEEIVKKLSQSQVGQAAPPAQSTYPTYVMPSAYTLEQPPPPPPVPDLPSITPEVPSAPGRESGDVSGFASTVPNAPQIFMLQSADKSSKLVFTGQIEADNHTYLNRRDTTDDDGFLLRRARIAMEGTMAGIYEFRLMPDFAQGKAFLTDAYINIHYIDEFQFTTGKFKQPVSYEEMIVDRFLPTVERSIIDQLMPVRDPGAMIHGEKLLGDRVDYAVSLSNGGLNGVSATPTSTNNDIDSDGNFEIDFRIAVRPFRGLFESSDGLLENLQLGVSGSWGIVEGEMNPLTLKTSGGVPWLLFNSTTTTTANLKTGVVTTTTTIVQAAGPRTRIDPELSCFYGPIGFSAQYLHEDQDMLPSATSSVKKRVDVTMDGFNCMFTCLLTGETRTTYNEYIVPLRPVDFGNPFRNYGTWELVAAASRLDLSRNVFTDNLASSSSYSRGATELTFGFNWYLNRWVRMQFNWEHAMFDTPVKLGSGKNGMLSDQDTLLTRLQIVF